MWPIDLRSLSVIITVCVLVATVCCTAVVSCWCCFFCSSPGSPCRLLDCIWRVHSLRTTLLSLARARPSTGLTQGPVEELAWRKTTTITNVQCETTLSRCICSSASFDCLLSLAGFSSLTLSLVLFHFVCSLSATRELLRPSHRRLSHLN